MAPAAPINTLLDEFEGPIKKYGLVLNPNLRLEIRVSNDINSVNGEKTKSSIISKMIRRVQNDRMHEYTVLDLPDLIRSTAVVENYGHIPHFMDLLKSVYPDIKGNRPDHTDRGYKGTHMSYLVEGLAAETQIVSPMQASVDKLTRQLFNKLRELPPGSPERLELEILSKQIYDRFFDLTNYWHNDLAIRSKIFDYGRGRAHTDASQIPPNIAKELSRKPYKIKNGQPVFDRSHLEYQAEVAQDFAIRRQAQLTRVNKEMFSIYNKQRRHGPIETSLTKRQTAIQSRFQRGLINEAAELERDARGSSEEYIKKNYGEIMEHIEDKLIIPYVESSRS